jgi:hypothetical protein
VSNQRGSGLSQSGLSCDGVAEIDERDGAVLMQPLAKLNSGRDTPAMMVLTRGLPFNYSVRVRAVDTSNLPLTLPPHSIVRR